MSAAVATLPPPSTALRLLEVRVLPEFSAFWLTGPWLSSVTPSAMGIGSSCCPAYWRTTTVPARSGASSAATPGEAALVSLIRRRSPMAILPWPRCQRRSRSRP
jgi:hypothetical protein